MIAIIIMSLKNSYFIFLICSSVTWLHIDMKSISRPKELSDSKNVRLGIYYYGAGAAAAIGY
jgi:hypothetical protein